MSDLNQRIEAMTQAPPEISGAEDGVRRKPPDGRRPAVEFTFHGQLRKTAHFCAPGGDHTLPISTN